MELCEFIKERRNINQNISAMIRGMWLTDSMVQDEREMNAISSFNKREKRNWERGCANIRAMITGIQLAHIKT